MVGQLLGVAQLLPQLLGHVGGKWVQQLQQQLVLGLGRTPLIAQRVDVDHQLGNGGVGLQRVNVLADLLDGAVGNGLQLGADALAGNELLAHRPDLIEEALAALDGGGVPRGGLLKVADEHLIQAQRVGTVLVDHIVGVDDVAEGLGHLDDGVLGHLAVLLDKGLARALLVAVLGQQALALGIGLVLKGMGVQAQDHAVGGTLLVRLLGGHNADVIQELVPETAVQQVQGGVLHAAVVPVHRRPVLQRLLGGNGILAVRIHVAQEVPGRTGPLGHGIGLTGRGAAAAGAGGLDPVGVAGQRGLAVGARLKVGDVGQRQGQAAFGQGLPAALLALDHGDGFAPVALAAEHPVAQLVVDLILALAVAFQPLDHLFLGVGDGQAVEEAGVDQRAGGNVGEGSLVEVRRRSALDDLDDGQTELLGELPVAGVVGGHGHDGAGAVGCQNVVGDKDGDLLAVDGVDALDALDDNAGLFLVQLGALEVRLAGGLLLIGGDGVGVPDKARVDPLFDEGVLGADDHVGRAEQRVRAGGVDRQGVARGGVEVDLGAVAAADPVALLGLDAVISPVTQPNDLSATFDKYNPEITDANTAITPDAFNKK